MTNDERDLLDYENMISEHYRARELYNKEQEKEMKDVSNGKAMKFIMDIYGDDSIWGEETIEEKPVKVLEVIRCVRNMYIEALVIRKDGRHMIFVGEVFYYRGDHENPPECSASFYYRTPEYNFFSF